MESLIFHCCPGKKPDPEEKSFAQMHFKTVPGLFLSEEDQTVKIFG